MREMTHTPADVRERVKGAWATVEAAALAQANLLDSHYGGQPAKAAEIRNAVEQVAALLRSPRGEGEAMDADAMWNHWISGHEDAALQGLRTATDDEAHRFLGMVADWQRCPKPSDHDAIAALRPEAQGEDTIPVSALRSEIAQLKAHGLLPYLAWARLCALAGGEPVGEDTPAALRSEAQREDRWEDLVFGPITEAYNEAHAARRGEGGGE